MAAFRFLIIVALSSSCRCARPAPPEIALEARLVRWLESKVEPSGVR